MRSLGEPSRSHLEFLKPLNSCLQTQDYPLPRNDACIACLHLDYPPVRYPMFPPTCTRRQAAANRSRIYSRTYHILSYDHFPITTRRVKGTCIYMSYMVTRSSRVCSRAIDGDRREKMSLSVSKRKSSGSCWRKERKTNKISDSDNE